MLVRQKIYKLIPIVIENDEKNDPVIISDNLTFLLLDIEYKKVKKTHIKTNIKIEKNNCFNTLFFIWTILAKKAKKTIKNAKKISEIMAKKIPYKR